MEATHASTQGSTTQETCEWVYKSTPSNESTLSEAAYNTIYAGYNRGFVSLIDMSSTPDDDYKFIMNYRDLSSGRMFLRPLKTPLDTEIAATLLKIFLEIGFPDILHTPDHVSLTLSVVKEVMVLWPKVFIVAGERMNFGPVTDKIKYCLAQWKQKTQSASWSSGIQRVQYLMNLTRTDSNSPSSGLVVNRRRSKHCPNKFVITKQFITEYELNQAINSNYRYNFIDDISTDKTPKVNRKNNTQIHEILQKVIDKTMFEDVAVKKPKSNNSQSSDDVTLPCNKVTLRTYRKKNKSSSDVNGEHNYSTTDGQVKDTNISDKSECSVKINSLYPLDKQLIDPIPRELEIRDYDFTFIDYEELIEAEAAITKVPKKIQETPTPPLKNTLHKANIETEKINNNDNKASGSKVLAKVVVNRETRKIDNDNKASGSGELAKVIFNRETQKIEKDNKASGSGELAKVIFNRETQKIENDNKASGSGMFAIRIDVAGAPPCPQIKVNDKGKVGIPRLKPTCSHRMNTKTENKPHKGTLNTIKKTGPNKIKIIEKDTELIGKLKRQIEEGCGMKRMVIGTNIIPGDDKSHDTAVIVSLPNKAGDDDANVKMEIKMETEENEQDNPTDLATNKAFPKQLDAQIATENVLETVDEKLTNNIIYANALIIMNKSDIPIQPVNSISPPMVPMYQGPSISTHTNDCNINKILIPLKSREYIERLKKQIEEDYLKVKQKEKAQMRVNFKNVKKNNIKNPKQPPAKDVPLQYNLVFLRQNLTQTDSYTEKDRKLEEREIINYNIQKVIATNRDDKKENGERKETDTSILELKTASLPSVIVEQELSAEKERKTEEVQSIFLSDLEVGACISVTEDNREREVETENLTAKDIASTSVSNASEYEQKCAQDKRNDLLKNNRLLFGLLSKKDTGPSVTKFGS